MSVEELGKKLLGEVEEIGLDVLLNALRMQDDTAENVPFGLAPLDGLIGSMNEARPSISKNTPSNQIIELMSLRPGDGKTHLLYHLTALAVLPKRSSGRQAAAIIIDADGRFSVPRLAQHMRNMLLQDTRLASEESRVNDALVHCLKHVHVFRPQSLGSTIATLHSLQGYLFNANRHHSFDRAIAFIAIDSVTAFYWQNKSETENAALLASASGDKAASSFHGYVQLAAAVKSAAKAFDTTVVFTASNLAPIKQTPTSGPDARSIRPSLPPPWQTLPTLRLVVRRTPVRKLPMEITLDDALRESENRQKIVDRGRFECFINEWGLDERTLQKLYSGSTGFDFQVTADAVNCVDPER